MIINGNKISEEIKKELAKKVMEIGKSLVLVVVQVGKNEVSERFIRMKQKFADDIGVETKVYYFPDNIDAAELKKKIEEICLNQECSGVIVQLPLPERLRNDTSYILSGIKQEKDVDVLSPDSVEKFEKGEEKKILPPVASAVKRILEEAGIKEERLREKNILIIGTGALVGKSVATWLLNIGVKPKIADNKTLNLAELAGVADIIISGTGQPGLIKLDMIKEGAIAIDAGTAEQSGKLAGDMDPEVEKKASFFTPVPGGVGPVVVAMLFKNLIDIQHNRA